MFDSKKILLFPGKKPKNDKSVKFLPTVMHIFSLPPVMEKDINSFLEGEDVMGEEFSVFGDDVSYLICHPEISSEIEIGTLIDQLRESGQRIIVLASEKVVLEIYKNVEDCYLHEPEKDDKEYFIKFFFPPDPNYSDMAIPLSVNEISFGKVYLS